MWPETTASGPMPSSNGDLGKLKVMLGDPTDEVEERHRTRGETGSKSPKTDSTGDIWKKPTFNSGREY